MGMKPILATCSLLAVCAPASAQMPARGPELQVNITTSLVQQSSVITRLGTTGNYVVVWSSTGQDGSGDGVVGRRLDSNGAPIGAEFPINAFTTGFQFPSGVASDAAGNFVVVWNDLQTGGDFEVRARRFDSSGAPLGGDILVNAYTNQFQALPAVAMSSTGEFVVVWESGPYSGAAGQDGSDLGVFGRRFDAAGGPLGGEFQINQYTTGRQELPSVAMDASGGFLVAWKSDQDVSPISSPGGGNHPNGGGGGPLFGDILARRYDNTGTPAGGEFQVNTTGAGSQYAPDVAIDSTGKTIVTWSSYLQDGSAGGVYAQRLDATGNKLGPEFNVNTYTTGIQSDSRIAVAPDDSFAIVWMSAGQDDPNGGNPFGIFGQLFDSSGKRAGAELPINLFTVSIQWYPHVAAGNDGMFVVVWDSFNQDGSNMGVESRAAGFPAARPAAVDSRASGGASNINGVLEVAERVTVDTAYRNGSASPLALTGAASNAQGPAGGTYTLNDTVADYESIGAGAEADCFTATADCYELTVGGTRPQPHWDAAFDETLSSNAFVKPWTLHVGGSFPDVPQNAFYPFIENLFHNAVTGGCAGGGYCPGNNVTRAQMAVFLLKARWGSLFIPAPATGTAFPDVPASNPFAPWIEELVREGITAGCGGGLYCPNNPVTRQQMAVFLLKTQEGSAYDPPDCAGIFDDVTCTPGTGFSDWVEELAGRGITGGCQASPPLYCPTASVLRQQMAVFLVKTFGLELYGN
jgi:hypothetical protein